MKFSNGTEKYKGHVIFKRTNDMFLTLFEYWIQNEK